MKQLKYFGIRTDGWAKNDVEESSMSPEQEKEIIDQVAFLKNKGYTERQISYMPDLKRVVSLHKSIPTLTAPKRVKKTKSL